MGEQRAERSEEDGQKEEVLFGCLLFCFLSFCFLSLFF